MDAKSINLVLSYNTCKFQKVKNHNSKTAEVH